MSDRKAVALVVASEAAKLVPQLIRDPALPRITTQAIAEDAIDQVVTQDQAVGSKRVWSMLFAIATAVLAVPEVIDLLGPWAPVATAVLSAVLAAWSKAADPRPART